MNENWGFFFSFILRADLSETIIIINTSKVRREREEARSKSDTVFINAGIWGLSFNWRRDTTLTQFRDVKTWVNHRRIIREEHITLLKEVGSVFIGFITTPAEDANTISASLIQKLNVIDSPLNWLRAIGADGQSWIQVTRSV